MQPAAWDVQNTRLRFLDPPTATGHLGLASETAYVVADGSAEDLSGLSWSGPSVRVLKLTYEVRTIPNPLGGGPVTQREQVERTETTLKEATANFSATERDPDLTLHIEDAVLEGRTNGVALAYAPQRIDATACGGEHPECIVEMDHPRAVEFGGEVTGIGLDLRATGPATIRVLDGVRVQMVGSNGEFDVTTGPTAVTSPDAGDAGVVRHTYVYLWTEPGELDLRGDVQGLIVGMGSPRANVDGTLVGPRVSGTVDAGGRVLALDDERLELEGAITFDLQPGDADEALVATSTGGDASATTVSGTASRVTVAGAEYALPPWRDAGRVAAGATLAIMALAIIEKLRATGLIALGPLYTRLTRREVLENETRSGIYAMVQEHPGLHFRAILRESDVAAGTLQHHLAALERKGFVRAVQSGQHKLYFPTGVRAEVPVEVHAMLTSETREELARALLATPGSTQADIAEALGLKQTTVSYNLRKLEEAGLIVSAGGRPKRYEPTTTLEQALMTAS